MNKTKNILVTGAGGPAAISFINAIAHLGHSIVAADMDPHAAGLYVDQVEKNALILPGSHLNFAEHLLMVCIEHRIDILVPTVDKELLPISRHRNEFKKHGIDILIAPETTLLTCLDKLKLHETMKNTVNCPATAVMHPDINTKELCYPLIIKPRSGSGSKGIKMIHNATDFETHHFSEDWIIQSNLPGAEYSVDVYANNNGHIIAAVPRERLKIDSGVAVTARTVLDPKLIELAKKVATVLNLKGVANVQLKMDQDDNPALLEVNPRFPGTMALTVASGVNIPAMSIHELTGVAVETHFREFSNIAIVRTYQEHIVCADELEDMMHKKPFKREKAVLGKRTKLTTKVDTQAQEL